MRKSTLTFALLLAGGATIATIGAVTAQEMQPPINADEVKWGPAPPNIPAGAQIAVLAGNPASDGPYVVRLKMPANYKVPAHYHPKDETVTVISGDFHVGMGDKL
jgi:quercetin dioxygenase-like cupin family protein